MKKLIALLLAAIMLFSVSAFAEEEVTATPDPEVEIVNEVLDNNNAEGTVNGVTYTLSIDQVPEGYEYSIFYTPGYPCMFISNIEDPEANPIYVASLYDDREEYGDKGFIDFTDEEMDDYIADLCEEIDEPTVEKKVTGHGSPYIQVTENDADYALLVCLYKGFVISVSITSMESAVISDAELEIAGQIMTDLWPVENNL